MNKNPCQGHENRNTVEPDVYATGSKVRGSVRASKMGRRRAIALLLIHVFAFLHILHWRMTGQTLTPLEPSEAMFTLRDGLVNAGAILMLVATLSVLVLGRFFCGWACHLVAIQDACAWLLKKLGIRPRPLRSRFLVFVPVGAAFVMFGMPLIARYRHDLGLPEFSSALVKAEFWETFPGPWLTIATFLVSGCLMVYVLGAKGFCTYACPYGGVFMLAEKFAPGRIRVTDACKACGHCTAVCTSNVQVAAEVHQFGMVVDSGCMKCLDCVSSCPEEALYFGFGKPALGAKKRRPSKAKRGWTFGWKVDLTIVVVFSLSLATFAGLPDTFAPWGTSLHGQTPLLFSLSLSAITAFLVGLFLHGLKAPEIAITNHHLKKDNQWTRSGRGFQILTVLWSLIVIQFGVVQYSTFVGNHAFTATEVSKWAWRQDGSKLPEDVAKQVERSRTSYLRAESWSMLDDARYPARLSWLAIVENDTDSAIQELKRAAKIAPENPEAHSDLASIYSFLKQWQPALEAMQQAIELRPENAIYQRQKFNYARAANDPKGMVEAMEALLYSLKGPNRQQSMVDIAVVRLRLGDKGKAKAAVEMLRKEFPDDPRIPQIMNELSK
ncbi:MAG: ferredoxin [Planctomycetota bacterium]|jgi:ferredoxin